MGVLGKTVVALRRMGALISRGRRDDDLRMEIDEHIALRREALIQAGSDPDTAAREARRMFGNVTAIREETREMWTFPRLESVAQDVKHGARLLWRSPVLTLVAVLSIGGGLAIGVGMFMFLNAVVYRPLSVGDGTDIYRVFTSDHDSGQFGSSSYPDYEAFRQARVFSSSCATTVTLATMGIDGVAAQHSGEIVNPDCFDALQLSPRVGRFFDQSTAGSTESVPIVISHSLWTRRFAADLAVVGRPVVLNGSGATIVGVAPRSFLGTNLDAETDFWAPVALAPAVLPAKALTNRRYRGFRILARLPEGIGREQAEARLAVVAAQLRQVDDRAWTNAAGSTRKVTVMRELDARFAGSPGTVAAIGLGLLAAAAAVVALACVNLATMLLARGAARAREFSIRLAIGASRRRVLRQLVTESLIIAALGALVATATLVIGLRIFEANRPPGLPAFDLAVDWRVMTFATVTALFAAVLFGLGPAIHAVRLAIADGLKNRPLVGRIRRLRIGARETLIVVQVTASIALVLTSTLFVSALGRGTTVSPGFEPEGIAVVPVEFESIPDKELPDLTARLIEAARAVPGVERVSAAGLVPLMYSAMEFGGGEGGQQPRSFLGNVVSPGYFETLQIPLRAGRDFDGRERQTSVPVAIVSETLARSMWPSSNPIGQTLVVDNRILEVVGVVADIRYRALTEPFQPLVYLPVSQVLRARVFIHARVRPGGETLRRLEDTLRGVERRAAVDTAMPMPMYLEKALVAERATRWAGAALGIVQLALAVLSLWGLVTYAVERRTPEMGIRLALGATPRDLVRLMMRPAVALILAGVVFGCITGIITSQVVLSTSVGLAPLDLVAVVPVAIAFTAAAMFSAWWPARRAGLADPAASLRHE